MCGRSGEGYEREFDKCGFGRSYVYGDRRRCKGMKEEGRRRVFVE